MNDVNIKSTHNDPIIGLMQQANQLKSQVREHSKFDLDVVNFNNQKSNSSQEIKLFIPTETFVPSFTNDLINKHELINVCLRIITVVILISLCILFSDN